MPAGCQNAQQLFRMQWMAGHGKETLCSIEFLVQLTSNTSPKLPWPTSRWILKEWASTEVPSVLLVPTAVEPVPACIDTERRAFKHALRLVHRSVEYTRLAAYIWPTMMAYTAQGVRLLFIPGRDSDSKAKKNKQDLDRTLKPCKQCCLQWVKQR